jgi:hypothetical protein
MKTSDDALRHTRILIGGTVALTLGVLAIRRVPAEHLAAVLKAVAAIVQALAH